MPSGATHDRLILWNLPLVGGAAWLLTSNVDLVLASSGAYLFSGLVFGPDLDTRSRHYRRWGLLRWLWLPYQRILTHRSMFSHGPILGTCGRLLYLGLWLLLLSLIGNAIWVLWQAPQAISSLPQHWHVQGTQLWQFTQRQSQLLLAILVGLEIGAMNHSLSDVIGSKLKRLRRRSPKGHSQSTIRAKKKRR